MRFYLTVILTAALIIVAINLLVLPEAVTWQNVASVSLSVTAGVFSVITVDGIFALLIRRLLPSRIFSADQHRFRVGKKEYEIYRALQIKKWKGLIPELGCFTGFSKSHLESTDDQEYLARFLLESNYGVVIHLANAALGFLIAFIPPCSAPSVWIPVFLVNFLLSCLPVAVLRYTSYTLQKLYARCLSKSETPFKAKNLSPS